MDRLKIAINAQLVPDNCAGGTEHFLIALVTALGRLGGDTEEYFIIGPWQEPGWLESYVAPNERIVPGPQPLSKLTPLEILKRAVSQPRPLGREIWRRFSSLPQLSCRQWPEVPISQGFYESLGCDVMHFPYQDFTLCALPTIFNPHDLQHLHYPQFFTPSTIAWRETVYPTACHFAHTVAVGSQWVKQDVLRHYQLNADKIQVIPWAPPTQAYPAPTPDSLEAMKAKYQLQRPFIFYPAVTWPHKNHLRLLEALALLRDQQDLVVRLVCTGEREPHFWPRIEERLHELNLGSQVRFLGRIPPGDLRAVYRLSQFVVVPTLFEAASGPVFEAWEDGVPVGCSTVTSLPEQVRDAALLFDPFSVEAIAKAISRMAVDEHLRAELVSKGRQRLQDFSWERTAKAYRAIYRRAACHPLTEEDQWLLSWDWMRSPKPGNKGAS